jgi:AcrR family transcriptional regulator
MRGHPTCSKGVFRRQPAASVDLKDRPVVKKISRRKPKERRSQGRPSTAVAVGQKAVIAAVREALKTTPPGELTFNQIAVLAGVDQRLIRYYFGQLPDLLRAVAVEISQELRSRFVAAHRRDGSTRERIRQRVMIFLEMFGDNPHYHRLVVDFLVTTEGAERERALDGFRQSIKELDLSLREARDANGLGPLDARFAHVMTAAVCEFLFSARPVFTALFGPQAETPAFRQRYCELVTDLLIGPESPANTRIDAVLTSRARSD